MSLRTFSITTLGCRVNHYESEQLATLLRGRGLTQVPPERAADLRIVHTCSVTVQAASKSRQNVRRMTRLPVLRAVTERAGRADHDCAATMPAPTGQSFTSSSSIPTVDPAALESGLTNKRPRVVVTGCWATSDPGEAARLSGVDAVLGHHQDVSRELSRLLTQWESESTKPSITSASPERGGNDGWMKEARTPAGLIAKVDIKPLDAAHVKGKLEDDEKVEDRSAKGGARSEKSGGMVTLPQLNHKQGEHQRAFLKVQDGCDAHCTYCIIPRLRPSLWSKPIDDAVEEARRLVEAGHGEIVLTGIFLGAYGRRTALRRRQGSEDVRAPLAELVDALCTRVPALRRLRMSSMEPLDLTAELIALMKSRPQVVPHFHLPLQSGSDEMLRRMNRQYGRDEYLDMVARVKAAFDRPAITTDVIVGFPGETDEEFARTVEVVERVGFIHVHAFSYSPRPGTAAARWTSDYVRGPVVNRRIERLVEMSAKYSVAFRRSFLGEEAQVLVELAHPEGPLPKGEGGRISQHGRCERYFDVHFENEKRLAPGTPARVRIDRVMRDITFGTFVGVDR